MNRGRGQTSRIGGYTIVETLIFLAVSAAVFFMAVVLIGGRQGREQFSSSVRDFESRITDIANNVSTGYYQTSTAIPCRNSGGAPNFSGPAGELGTNIDCIFVGTVLKLGTGGNGNGREGFTQLTLAGVRLNGSGQNVQSIIEANPRVITVGDTSLTNVLSGGARVECVAIGNAPCTPGNSSNAAIGFLSTFDGASLSTEGSGIRVNVIAYNSVALDDDRATAEADINPVGNYAGASLNPSVTICLRSGGSNQYALVRIGSNATNSLTTSSEILNISGATPLCS